MQLLNDIDSYSDVKNLELIWKDPREFDKFVDKKIGRKIYDKILKTTDPQFNELNTSKCVQVSSNSSVVKDRSEQRLFNQDDEKLSNWIEYKKQNGKFFKSIKKNEIYHEKQVGNLCAKHAINNAVQYDLVTREYLSVCADELKKNDGVYHVSEQGEFDNQVIEYALNKLETFIVFNVDSEYFSTYLSITKDPVIVIITHQRHHYSACRFVSGGDLWRIDSLRPCPIIDNELFKEIESQLGISKTKDAPQIMAIIDKERTNQYEIRKLNQALCKLKVEDLAKSLKVSPLDNETKSATEFSLEIQNNINLSNKQFKSKPLDAQVVNDLQNNTLIFHDYFEQSQTAVASYTNVPIPVDSSCRKTISHHKSDVLKLKQVNQTSSKNESNSYLVTTNMQIIFKPTETETLPIEVGSSSGSKNEACEIFLQSKRKSVYKKHKTDRLDLNKLIANARENKKKVHLFKGKNSLVLALNGSVEYEKFLSLWSLKKLSKKRYKTKKYRKINFTNDLVELENGENQRKINVAIATGKELRLYPRTIEYVGSDKYLQNTKKGNEAVKNFRAK